MTFAQVVETPVNVISNSPSQDYTHPDDHNLRTYDMTSGFKPFTISKVKYEIFFRMTFLHRNVFLPVLTFPRLSYLQGCLGTYM